MNVQLANTISDLSGATGMAILRAILSGVRDPWQLAKLRDRRIQASEAEIAASLEGNWREDVLFELRQVVEGYDFYQRQICGGDQELEKRMAAVPARQEATAADKLVRRAKARGNQPQFDMAGELRRTLGVDLTTVDGIDVMTAQVFLSEVGPELGAFPSEDHFAAWLELAPRRDVSGGKVIRHQSRKSNNRVANALRMAAQSLWRSHTYLGARYRHLRARLGGQKAVKAMARYLACLVYRLLTKGRAYVDRGAAHFESKRTEREVLALRRKAAELGMQLTTIS